MPAHIDTHSQSVGATAETIKNDASHILSLRGPRRRARGRSTLAAESFDPAPGRNYAAVAWPNRAETCPELYASLRLSMTYHHSKRVGVPVGSVGWESLNLAMLSRSRASRPAPRRRRTCRASSGGRVGSRRRCRPSAARPAAIPVWFSPRGRVGIDAGAELAAGCSTSWFSATVGRGSGRSTVVLAVLSSLPSFEPPVDLVGLGVPPLAKPVLEPR